MAYEVQTITLKGAELLAAASAADRLILSGCAATQTFISQADAINISTVPADPYSTTTKVNIEGSENNHLFVYVLFVAGESTGGDCKSLYIYGHKESDPTHDYVLAVLSSNTPFHLPIVGEVSNTYGTSMDFVYAVADGAVSSIDNSAFVTRAEFNRLYERAVTTHAYGTPTIGEAQTIYGQKTFKEKVSIDFPGNAYTNFLQMTSSSYKSKLYGNAVPISTSQGVTFTTINGGLSFDTDYHKYELAIKEDEDGSVISNAYHMTDNNGDIYKTISSIGAGADYIYESGNRKQIGKIALKAANVSNVKTSEIQLKSSPSQGGMINVTSDTADVLIKDKVNINSDYGLKVNFTGSSTNGDIKVTYGEVDSVDDPVEDNHDVIMYSVKTICDITGQASGSVNSYLYSHVNTYTKESNIGIESNYGSLRSVVSTVAAGTGGSNICETSLAARSITTNQLAGVIAHVEEVRLIVAHSSSSDNQLIFAYGATSEGATYAFYPQNHHDELIDLGKSSDKFNAVYANYFYGTLNGESAYVYDADYLYGQTTSTPPVIGKSTGLVLGKVNNEAYHTSVRLDLRETTANILSGQLAQISALDGQFSGIGSICLCKWIKTSDTSQIDNGGEVNGIYLSPVSIRQNADNSITLANQMDSSLHDVVLSGRWKLLSYLDNYSGYGCVVLAVKIALTY